MSEYTEIEGIDDEGIDDEGIDDEGIQIDIIDTWSKYYQDKYAKEFSEIQKNGVTIVKLILYYLGEYIDTKIEKPAYPVNVKINGKVSLWKGDITRLQVDAIVNAANRSLLGGGGVDGCIHRAAGSGLLKECRKLNGCDTGDAKITLGYKLPAKYVIHTVGPIGKNKKALKNCYKNCLRLALAKEVRTLAFCCISTGIYGYPNRDAAEVALKTTRKWLEDKSNANAIDRIIFCLFLDKDIKIYHTLMLKYFPPEELKKPAKKTAEETTEVPAKPEKVKSTEIKESGEKELRVDDAKKRDKSEKNVDKKENKEMETDPDEERKTVEEMQKRRNEEDKASADKASAEEASAEEARAEEASAEEARAEEDRAEEARAEEASAEEASAEEVSAEEASAEEASAEKASAEEVSAEEVSAEEVSAKEASAEKASAEEASAEIPINPPKKQKQDDKINNETKDQEDVEMIEEDSQGREEQNTDDKKQVEKMQIQDEKMDVKDLPKQNTDEKDEQMRDQENKVYETVV